jgi:hypothetical protein
MYAQGLNQFIFHRYAQQPNLDAVPGMTMGCYGIHFDRTNTWFEQGRAWIQYLTRCQYLLQKGLFVADLLYFEGENAPVEAPAPAALTPPPPTGYDWDLIDSGALLERARAADGRIVLPDGMSYRVLILRADARLSLPVMRKIRDLVRQGVCVVGAKPQGSPSLMGYPESDSEVRQIADELWGESPGSDAVERTVGGGRVFCGQPLPAVLAKLGVTPDIEITSRSGTEQVYAIHRRIGDADVYFLCNHKRREEELVCTFRVNDKQPEFWDPATGATAASAVYDSAGGTVRVPVHLDPAGSVFVVFRSPAAGSRAVSVTRDRVAVLQASRFETRPAAPHRGVVNDFTISVWIKPELDTPLPAGATGPLAAPASYVFFPPAGDEMYGQGHASCGLTAGRNGLGLYERTRAGAATVMTVRTGVAGWTHVAVVYREGVPEIYLDGRLAQRGQKSGRLVHPGCGESNLGYGAPAFNGDTTEPELIPQALSAEEIRKLAAKGLPRPGGPRAVEASAHGLLIWHDGNYVLRGAAGKSSSAQVEGTEETEVTGPWEVTFPANRGAPPRVTLPRLISLHRHSDPGVRYFSGSATYSKPVAIPVSAAGKKKRLYLDLGRVEVLAEVRWNGKDLGIAWKPPYRLDITDVAGPGDNRLEVRVTNLWPNRLIGDEFLPPENEYSTKGTNIKDIGEIKEIPGWFLKNQPKPGLRTTFSTWRHYSEDSPLLESGLLGPVCLRTAFQWREDR